MPQFEHDFVFVMGGIASKTGKPYLKVSNGRTEFFVNIPKGDKSIDEDTFAGYNEGDTIRLAVGVLPGSEGVRFLSVVD